MRKLLMYPWELLRREEAQNFYGSGGISHPIFCPAVGMLRMGQWLAFRQGDVGTSECPLDIM